MSENLGQAIYYISYRLKKYRPNCKTDQNLAGQTEKNWVAPAQEDWSELA